MRYSVEYKSTTCVGQCSVFIFISWHRRNLLANPADGTGILSLSSASVYENLLCSEKNRFLNSYFLLIPFFFLFLVYYLEIRCQEWIAQNFDNTYTTTIITQQLINCFVDSLYHSLYIYSLSLPESVVDFWESRNLQSFKKFYSFALCIR